MLEQPKSEVRGQDRAFGSGGLCPAQPSPGGKGPESLQTRSRVDTPSVAWGPPAGLHPAVVHPVVPGTPVGAERRPLRRLGVAGQPSLPQSMLCPLWDCRDIWGRSPGVTLVLPLLAS